MAELKTRKTEADVHTFLKSLKDPERLRECEIIIGLMAKSTKSEPAMWGKNIVGFGKHQLQYANGRQLDWFLIGFSPRKNALTLYLGSALHQDQKLLEKLGKHKTGGGCLYIRRLSEVDLSILSRLIIARVKNLTASHEPSRIGPVTE